MSSSHILKSTAAGFEHCLFNEAFCQALALMVGLRPVGAQMHRVDGRTFLQIDRYDRVSEGQGGPAQLRQQDFCAALGVAPGEEYEREGGPDLAQCFALLRNAARPSAPQVLRLLDYVIFNALIGNDQAHAGSYSLLYFGAEAVLAPLHGALSTAVYAASDCGMAMRIGSQHRFDALGSQDWEQFAVSAGLEGTLVRRRVLELAQTMPPEARRLHLRRDYGFADNALVAHIVALIEQRCNIAARSLTS